MAKQKRIKPMKLKKETELATFDENPFSVTTDRLVGRSDVQTERRQATAGIEDDLFFRILNNTTGRGSVAPLDNFLFPNSTLSSTS